MAEHVPEESLGDKLHQLARAAVSAVPFAGGPAAVLFNMFVRMPIQHRWKMFFEDLAERVVDLEQSGRVKVEDLQNNDEFISTLMQASQLAMRNHQQEKLEALRNAVLNTALGQSPEDAKREMFLSIVDRSTVLHLRTLVFLADPKAGIDAKKVNVDLSAGPDVAVIGVLQAVFPEMADQAELAQKVIDDLDQDRLILEDVAIRWGQGIIGRQNLTQLGAEFLRFISEPIGKGEK